MGDVSQLVGSPQQSYLTSHGLTKKTMLEAHDATHGQLYTGSWRQFPFLSLAIGSLGLLFWCSISMGIANRDATLFVVQSTSATSVQARVPAFQQRSIQLKDTTSRFEPLQRSFRQSDPPRSSAHRLSNALPHNPLFARQVDKLHGSCFARMHMTNVLLLHTMCPSFAIKRLQLSCACLCSP